MASEVAGRSFTLHLLRWEPHHGWRKHMGEMPWRSAKCVGVPGTRLDVESTSFGLPAMAVQNFTHCLCALPDLPTLDHVRFNPFMLLPLISINSWPSLKELILCCYQVKKIRAFPLFKIIQITFFFLLYPKLFKQPFFAPTFPSLFMMLKEKSMVYFLLLSSWDGPENKTKQVGKVFSQPISTFWNDAANSCSWHRIPKIFFFGDVKLITDKRMPLFLLERNFLQ